MPAPDPIISDFDAATLFEIEDQIIDKERKLALIDLQRKDVKADLADALDRRAKFTRGLKERHPLFDREEAAC